MNSFIRLSLIIGCTFLVACSSHVRHPYTGNRVPASLVESNDKMKGNKLISPEEFFFVMSTHLKMNKNKVGKCYVKVKLNEIENKLSVWINKSRFDFVTEDGYGVYPRIAQNSHNNYHLMNPTHPEVKRVPASAFDMPEWASLKGKSVDFKLQKNKIESLNVSVNDDGFGDEPKFIKCM